MEESARFAEPSDLDAIVTLAEAALDELTPTKGGAVWVRREARPQPVAPSIEEALADPDHTVVVGQLDQAVVGYAIARVEHLRDRSTLAVLDDLYVDADARSLGVGELMMNEVIDWATARGCIGIDSLALPGNRATKNFFESFGLVARAIIVHRPFTADDPTDRPTRPR